ncbi:MAG: hypothetical protein P4L56_06875 [Candidatus Sulfopaludibacter sp.]|nr:hypothetical protein [Candidatus Sulfopaludibacter sp.]
MRAQLAREGFPSKGPEDDWTVKGTRDIFLISADTQHGVNREVKTRLDAFLKQYGDQGRQDPDHIKFLTYTTRYNQCFRVTLDALDNVYERAEVDAARETSNAAANRQALRTLEHFDREWAMNYRVHPRIKDDKDVTQADFARYNVVLFGDPGSNSWIARVAAKLPLHWTRETIAVAGNSAPSAEHLPVLAYPNPLSPAHYVVLLFDQSWQLPKIK